jgi:hypothetical protein
MLYAAKYVISLPLANVWQGPFYVANETVRQELRAQGTVALKREQSSALRMSFQLFQMDSHKLTATSSSVAISENLILGER